jgi:hypothetical protein
LTAAAWRLLEFNGSLAAAAGELSCSKEAKAPGGDLTTIDRNLCSFDADLGGYSGLVALGGRRFEVFVKAWAGDWGGGVGRRRGFSYSR